MTPAHWPLIWEMELASEESSLCQKTTLRHLYLVWGPPWSHPLLQTKRRNNSARRHEQIIHRLNPGVYPCPYCINLLPCQWKLFREMFIHLNITTLADIVTACGKYITKKAEAGKKSYESIHKWPRQQHHISNEHRELWTTCMSNITQQGSRQLRQPLGIWNAVDVATYGWIHMISSRPWTLS